MKLSVIVGLAAFASGHGAGVRTKPDGLSWEQWHMVEEHGLDVYDDSTMFKLHDLTGTGQWTRNDILNLYGLLRESVGDGSGMGSWSEGATDADKDNVYNSILEVMDTNKDGQVSLEEFKNYKKKNLLPDFGFGQGHHLDFESEYEDHHWIEHHQGQDPDVLIKHKEDIEHELLHHEHEIHESHESNLKEREALKSYLSNINLENLPVKYRS